MVRGLHTSSWFPMLASTICWPNRWSFSIQMVLKLKQMWNASGQVSFRVITGFVGRWRTLDYTLLDVIPLSLKVSGLEWYLRVTFSIEFAGLMLALSAVVTAVLQEIIAQVNRFSPKLTTLFLQTALATGHKSFKFFRTENLRSISWLTEKLWPKS